MPQFVAGNFLGVERLEELPGLDAVVGIGHKFSTTRTDTNASLAKAFSALAKFPKLENLVFNFSPVYIQGDLDEMEYDALPSDSLQHALIAALINNPLPPLLSSLSLVNVVTPL